MRTTQAGLNFIAAFEGFEPHLYNDPVNHCTIGIGHLVHTGPCNGSEPAEFRAGISRERGLELLAQDAVRFEQALASLVTVPLKPHQADALISFMFNVGAANFTGSDLRAALNAGNFGAVPGELQRWIFAKKQVLPGLVRRRKQEGHLFATGQYGAGGEVPEPRAQIQMPWMSQLDTEPTASRWRRDALAACGAMVLAHFGKRLTVNEVGEALPEPGEGGFFILDLQNVQPPDWPVRWRWQGNISEGRLQGELDAGRPVILFIDAAQLPDDWRFKGHNESHFVVAVGLEHGRVHYLDPHWPSEGAGRCWLEWDRFRPAWESLRIARTPRQGLLATPA